MESEVKHGGRRRSTNYPMEFKRKLAQHACEPGVSVSQLALQHQLNSKMVFTWRRQRVAVLVDQRYPRRLVDHHFAAVRLLKN